jgi:CRISPR system Cascade subunit CasC
MLVETGRRQPRSLASAFRNPIPLKSADLFPKALAAIAAQLGEFDGAYGGHEARTALCTIAVDLPGVTARRSLDDVAARTAAAVRGEAA